MPLPGIFLSAIEGVMRGSSKNGSGRAFLSLRITI